LVSTLKVGSLIKLG